MGYDAKNQKSGVFRIAGPGRHRGWSRRVDTELGNYDYLLGKQTFHAELVLLNRIPIGDDVIPTMVVS